MAMAQEYQLQIDDGWQKIKENAISKLESYLNTGNSKIMFTKKEYMELYT